MTTQAARPFLDLRALAALEGLRFGTRRRIDGSYSGRRRALGRVGPAGAGDVGLVCAAPSGVGDAAPRGLDRGDDGRGRGAAAGDSFEPDLADCRAAARRQASSPGELPVISFQPYGGGRVVVVEGAGMWRWAFLPPTYAEHHEVYAALWQSLLRWLVSGAGLLPGQKLALRTDKVIFRADEPATGRNRCGAKRPGIAGGCSSACSACGLRLGASAAAGVGLAPDYVALPAFRRLTAVRRRFISAALRKGWTGRV